MSGKLIKTLKNWRVIMLFIFLLSAVWALQPNFWTEGVLIKSVAHNSTAALAGVEQISAKTLPMARERILSVNNQPVNSEADYYAIVSRLGVNKTVSLKTSKGLYRFSVREAFRTILLNETENVTVEETRERNVTINGTLVPKNVTVNVSKQVQKVRLESLGPEDIGLRVGPAPTSNLRKGLDLQGGTRVILKPSEEITDDIMEALIDNMQERLNVYGLSDVVVTEVRSKGLLGGSERFILVEMAGVSEEEVRELLSHQGKFEAKIANQTVFMGGDDITYVCRTAQCAGINPRQGCGQSGKGFACGFYFQITLGKTAAQRQADATAKLDVNVEDRSYLSEPIVLFLDDQEVDSLQIASDLKGRAVTAISISGSGAGPTLQEARDDATRNMKRLQTILITGSLPTSIEVVRTDTLSPVLGQEFIKNAWIMGLLALVAVAGVLIIYYRSLKIALPIIFTSLSEILLVLGAAALIGWSIDVAAIAGIIASVGTGVDDQIIITDEILYREKETQYQSWKDRIKKAFFIIFSSAATTCVAMFLLWVSGAGLLKGFAITTILGVFAGVFITRPAYAIFIEALFKDKQ